MENIQDTALETQIRGLGTKQNLRRCGNPNWKKGESGNPKGRKRAAMSLSELAKRYGPEIVDRLVFWLRSENARASIAAAQTLLDRGWGKAMQPIEANVSLSFAELVAASFKNDGKTIDNPVAKVLLEQSIADNMKNVGNEINDIALCGNNAGNVNASGGDIMENSASGAGVSTEIVSIEIKQAVDVAVDAGISAASEINNEGYAIDNEKY